MENKVSIQGGGSEGEEWVACTVKIMKLQEKFWRHMRANQIFEDIQEAIDSLA